MVFSVMYKYQLQKWFWQTFKELFSFFKKIKNKVFTSDNSFIENACFLNPVSIMHINKFCSCLGEEDQKSNQKTTCKTVFAKKVFIFSCFMLIVSLCKITKQSLKEIDEK